MTSSHTLCLVILASIAGAASNQQPAPLTASDLVIAGVEYGADTALVRSHLGTPRTASRLEWKYAGIRVQLDSGQATMLHVTSSRWSTRRGIAVGSSLAAVRRAYGDPAWAND